MTNSTTTTDVGDDGEQSLALKFLGMSAAVDNPPGVGDTQMFTVTARCVGYGADERQSGGLIGYRKMRVLHVEPGAIEKAPPQAEQLTLGDAPGLGEDLDEDDDETGERAETTDAETPAPGNPFAPPSGTS